MSNVTGLKSDNILGYRIIEKIGAGGFGEVYKAMAPGGLMKAVKILFGYHDERRAKDELKSLDRIKELRHPFLLSLERIEVVDKQLVVITELADRSLGDLFNSYVAAGQSGIPREELLHYMQQAADALDYLANDHKLQHLDVKPENLLLVGKHVKLADFGLVKDLKDVSQSLMGGLTPAFSAPELFDGRPSMQSDQYALSIVFQEMLTGVRPFTGSSLAQLAAQHIHGQPDLSPLPEGDRAVIGRALSKKPEQRFPGCSVMIEALLHQRLIARNNKRTQIPGRKGIGAAHKPVGPRIGDTSCHEPTCHTPELCSHKTEVSLVDPPPSDGMPQSICPVLLVGVGHTATRILQRLKQNVNSRIGNLAEMPSVKIVCMDTERFAGGDSNRPDESIPLDASEQVLLPLRRSEEYRSRSEIHTAWLNRRWIYNVPKTLQTEGLRPLGRLAFVDNFPALCEGLEQAIGKISSKQALATTSERMGVDPDTNRVKVFILSSVSGGLGSGMTLDLAYTIRLILDEHNLGSDNIHGLFLHATSSQKSDVGISVANTFAFLTELRHITQEGYAGEAACGIPQIQEHPPFDYPYFLHLGDNSDRNAWDQSLDSVSEYLYHNIFSRSAPFFDNCRKLESEIGHFAFRSFGMESVGIGENSCQRLLAGFLKENLLARWQSSRKSLSASKTAEALELETSPENLDVFVRGVISKIHPVDESAPLANRLARWATDRTLSEDAGCEILGELDALIGEPLQDGSSPLIEMNEDQTDEFWKHGKQLCKKADDAFSDCFRQDRLSFSFAQETVQRMMDHVEKNRATLSSEIAALYDDNSKMLAALRALRRRAKDSPDDSSIASSAAERFHNNRLRAIEKRAALELLLSVARHLKTLKADGSRLRDEVSAAIHRGDVESNPRNLLKQFEGFQQKLASSLVQAPENILENIERRLFLELVQPAGDYWSLLQNSSFIRRYLPDAVEQAVRAELASAGRKIDLDRAFADYLESSPGAASGEIGRMISRSMPMVAGCGGPTRMMVGVPQHTESIRVTNEIFSKTGVAGQVVSSTTGDLVIATETEDVSLAEIAFKMLETRSDCVELARRLQSRTDVQWKSLEDLL